MTAYYGKVGAVNYFVYVELEGEFENLQVAAGHARSFKPPEGFLLLAVSLPSDHNALAWVSEERSRFEKLVPLVVHMNAGSIQRFAFAPPPA